MINGLVKIFIWQGIGELASKFLLPQIPGPVLGLILLVTFLEILSAAFLKSVAAVFKVSNCFWKLDVTCASAATLIFVSKDYYRPCEVDELLGDPSKAKKQLNWESTIGFDELVEEMVNTDCI